MQLRCLNCGEEKIIPFSCKSRLCPSCSHIHLEKRIIKIKSIMIKGVGHRHVVLTTPKELWGYFFKDRSLLKGNGRCRSRAYKGYPGLLPSPSSSFYHRRRTG
ncbi:hypothetical protein CEE35_03080 [Candidatus Aerophobetes bacterium Ae_b3b]|nr:MAG: hypothetical protein CEE35_03080 [Candidatus Aerophobetes bacterium Ae_b3b]